MKIYCIDCDWKGDNSEKLTAPHPFEPACEVEGCPKCHGIDSLRCACDEPGCWAPGTSGFSSPTGYRLTCFAHSDFNLNKN